jgi:hypothetical protein
VADNDEVLLARRRERAVLRDALASADPELVAVYGRRRIGKTFLVREFFGSAIAFEITGSHAADRSTQLAAFATALGRAVGVKARLAAPRDWPEAFAQLEAHLEAVRPRGAAKRVVFFDELPWLATHRSGFLAAFEHFWNGWASTQPWLVVVICGSSASWMLSKVIKQRGGLHNRVTRRLRLEALTLGETREYLHGRGVRFGAEQVLELYMAFGGVPHYLNQAKAGQSAAQAIDRACFTREGMLRDEFTNLYAALFERSDRHEAVIRALAKRRGGMARDDLLAAAKIGSGGTASKVLDELEESGFITRGLPLGRTHRDVRFYLTDQYSLFYLTWIVGQRLPQAGSWLRTRTGSRHSAWSGLAFEAVCLMHVPAIKWALGIAGVETQDAGWWHRPTDADDEGTQIDLVIDRADRSTNICEMKYAQAEFVVDKVYARALERKCEVFRRVTGTRKALFLTLVTTVGVRNNEYAQRLGLQVVTLDALMRASVVDE